MFVVAMVLVDAPRRHRYSLGRKHFRPGFLHPVWKTGMRTDVVCGGDEGPI